MKNYISIFIAVILIVLLFSVGALVDLTYKQKGEIQRQESNFAQVANENKKYLLTVNELKMLMKSGDERLRKTDSILFSRDVKIKQLEKLHVTTVIIESIDTVYLTNADTLIVREERDSQLYKTPFTDQRNCIKIEGFVMSTDEFPSVAITSQHAEVETYELEVKRRWYQFWKPKRWSETYTKCGDMMVLDIKKAGK